MTTHDPGCLEDEQVAALLDERLGPVEHQTVARHLDACDACRGLVARLMKDRARGEPASVPVTAPDEAPPSAESVDLPALGSSWAGRYRIDRYVGEGGMGVVLAAWDETLERTVALKLIRPATGRREGLATRLVRESKAMAKLRHPNVITVYDVGTHDDQVYVAMEFVEGMTLRRWLDETRRPWAEVVAMFREAGQGLAAAHDVGLVHRDFKPDNVLVDGKGRPLVTDFGLARAAEAPPSGEITSGDWDEVRSLQTLTQTGAAVGTPAYMAPEQHMGQPVDVRADVFSFCVALYEGVYGARPFAGDSADELRGSIRKGPPTPPRDRDVPPWLTRVLRAGLAADPDRRPATMTAVLHALRPRRPRRWPWIAAGMAGVGAAAAAIALAAVPTAKPRRCDADPGLAQIWNETVAADLAARVRSSGVVEADKAWARLRTVIDDHTEGWASAHETVCAADSSSPESLIAVQLQCLDGQRRAVRALTRYVAEDPASVEQVIEMAQGIRPTNECLADNVLVRSPLPADPQLAERVDDLRNRLWRVEPVWIAGRFEPALERLEPLAQEAEALGYRPVEAEVLLYLGSVQLEAGRDPELAHQTLKKAAYAAEAGRHDIVAAQIWTLLVGHAVEDLEEEERAAEYAERANAALERLEGAGHEVPAERVALEANLGVLAWNAEDIDTALAHFERAYAIARRSDTDQLERAVTGMALVYEDQGRYAEALEAHERIHAELQETLRPNHPHLAYGHANRASLMQLMGRHDKALHHSTRALEIAEASLGLQHPLTAEYRNSYAAMLRETGRLDEAFAQHEQARTVLTKAYGPDSTAVMACLEMEAGVFLQRGEPAEAVSRIRRACATYADEFGADSIDVARCRVNLAEAIGLAGDPAAAVEMARASVEFLETKGFSPHDHAVALGVLGNMLLLAGEPTTAQLELERAMALVDGTDFDPGWRAVMRGWLARAVWLAPGGQARAVELAKRAQAVLSTHPDWNRREREALDAWLAERTK